MSFDGVEHVAIAEQDTDTVSAWYCEAFGFEVAYKNQKTPPTYFVKLGDSLIEMIPANDGERVGFVDDPEGNPFKVIYRPKKL